MFTSKNTQLLFEFENKGQSSSSQTQIEKVQKFAFQILKESEKGYLYEGNYFYTFNGETTSQLIENKIAETKNSNLFVLDIGTGNGALPNFLRSKYGINAFGISGPTRHLLADYIAVIDAHEFAEAPFFKKLSFDFIFSRFAFEHFTDPVKVLINAYDKLKINGRLIISEFEVCGITRKELTEIFDYMKEQGYQISWCSQFPKTYAGSSLFITRTIDKPSLSVPLEVVGIDPKELRASYRTTFDRTPSLDFKNR